MNSGSEGASRKDEGNRFIHYLSSVNFENIHFSGKDFETGCTGKGTRVFFESDAFSNGQIGGGQATIRA